MNGTPAGFFSFSDTSSWGTASMVVFGNKTVGDIPNIEVDLFQNDVPFAPFWGMLGDFCTVLGSTPDSTESSPTANGTPTTFPTTTATSLPPAQGESSGTVDQTGYDTDEPNLPTSYTTTATEVERTGEALRVDPPAG